MLMLECAFTEETWRWTILLALTGITGMWAKVQLALALTLMSSFLFPDNVGSYRAQLFVNGWQHGRRFGDYGELLRWIDFIFVAAWHSFPGPQTVFPVPPGILVQGHNTIALSVFTLNQSTPTIDGRDIQVRVDPVITTTTLDLQGLKVDSPDYNQVLG